MKKTIFTLFLMVLVPMIVYSQPRGRYNIPEFSKLSIGPTAGGIAAFVIADSEALFKFGYFVGGEVNIRPIRMAGLRTGFIYNKVIDTSEFYNIPLVLNIFTKNDNSFSVGPLLLLDAYGNRFDLADPNFGFTIGVSSSSYGLSLTYIPLKLIFNEEIENLNFFFGIGLKMTFLIQII